MQVILKQVVFPMLLALAVVLPLCPLIGTAQAQTQELSEAERKAAAREFLSQGIEAQKAGAHEKAIGFIKKADSVYEHPGHGYYLGISYAATGQLLYAKEAYQRFAIAEPTSEQMRKLQAEARAEMEKLDPRIPRLTIQVQEDALDKLQVLLNGKVVPPAVLNAPIRVNPGEHTVSIDSESYKLVGGELTLELAEGATELVQLELQAVFTRVGAETSEEPKTEEAPSPILAPAPAPEPKRSKGLFIGGVAVTGVGVVGLAVGGMFLAQAGTKKSDWEDLHGNCDTLDGEPTCTRETTNQLDELTKQEENARTSGAVSLVIGGAALATGVTLMVLSSGKRNKETVHRVRPVFGLQSLGIEGRF